MRRGCEIVFIVLFSCLSPAVYPQYPERNIKTIIHVSPGGGTDAMARLVLQFAGKKLDVAFIVENHQGAGGQVGYTTLAMAKPDGYTIGTITTASIITHELTRKNVSYNLRESFIPICRIVSDPSGIFVRTDSPIKSVEELMEKARNEPGMISCGGSMVWGTQHIHCILLEHLCGVRLNYIPFDGTAESRNNLLGGHIDAAVGGTIEFMPLLLAGKVRALALAGRERLKQLPDVPVYYELGYELEISSDKGLAAPYGTPPERIKLLSETILEILDDPEFLEQADKLMLTPTLAYLDHREFREYLYVLTEKLNTVIKK